MKRIFSDSSEVAHLWAHQLQDSASNQGRNFFFRDNVIYSYGHHFPCGKIVTNQNGDKAYILNADTYSNTTAKHQNMTRGAVPTGATVFTVPGCKCPEMRYNAKYMGYYGEALRGVFYYLLELAKYIGLQSRARTTDYGHKMFGIIDELRGWIKFWEMDHSKRYSINCNSDKYVVRKSIYTLLSEKNAVQKIMKKFCLGYNAEEIAQAVGVYNSLKYFGFMNTDMPVDVGAYTSSYLNGLITHYIGSDIYEKVLEVRKKEAKLRREREKEREAQELKYDQERLEKWHDGKAYVWNPSHSFVKRNGWHTALKVSDDSQNVKTSKGITISRDEAKRLWKIVKVFHVKGTFTHQLAVDVHGISWKFNSYENDILTAGCHKIHYSEMERVAKQLELD